MTPRRPVPLTAEGRARLETELHELTHVRRPELVELIARTRAEGDLRENFGYHDARQALGMLEGRVQAIEAMLRDAELIAEAPCDGTARMCSRVTIRDEFGDNSYTIVGPAEADISRAMISHESPLGAALMGRRTGDRVEFQTPAGVREARVIDVV